MNIFAGIDIFLPEKYRADFHTFCLTRTDGSQNNPENSPFPRMVDMWFLSFCIAVKEEIAPQHGWEKENTRYKAIEGNVFGSDDWRSNAMVLFAIAQTNDVNIADDPHSIIKLINAYAVAGLPRLLSILSNRGGETALDTLSDYVEELIRQ